MEISNPMRGLPCTEETIARSLRIPTAENPSADAIDAEEMSVTPFAASPLR